MQPQKHSEEFEIFQTKSFIRTQASEIRCNRCQSKNYIKAGSPKGKQQYRCKDCNRVFVLNSQQVWTEKDKSMICPDCESKELIKGGKRNGYQVYICKECQRTFSENVPLKSDLNSDLPLDASCPNCGECRFKKRGRNSSGSQIYMCKTCLTSFTKNTVIKAIIKSEREASDLTEYEKDVWDVRNLGITKKNLDNCYTLNFRDISLPWLLDATKKFIQYSLATLSFSTAENRLYYLRKFAVFLKENYPTLSPHQISRKVILEFINFLTGLNLKVSVRNSTIGTIKIFLELSNKNQWADVPKESIIYREDYCRLQKNLPKYIPEDVLEKLNQHLDLLPEPYMRMVLVMQECGMRISELCYLNLNCLIKNNHNNYFLAYHQFKMKKDVTIPISAELANVIQEQQSYIQENLPTNFEFLFCARRNSVTHRGVRGFIKNEFIPSPRPVNSKTFSDVLNGLAKDRNIHDASGKIWHFHPHQFRHTVGTRMINAGVPQYIVQRYLGHESPAMTMVYAHIHDETLRKEIEKYHEARVVNFQGETVELEDTILSSNDDLEWFKKNVQARALEHGYCARPKVLGNCDIPGFDGCYNCPHWRTNKNFLPILKDTLDRTNKVLEKARNCGWELQVNKNEPIKHNLEKVIQSLEVEGNE